MKTNETPKTILLEGMTSISALLDSAKINDRKIYRIWIDSAKAKKRAPEIRFLEAKQAEMGFELIATDEETISTLASGHTHGGILAECGERTISELSDEAIKKDGFYVYLEGMEDPYNFGGALRSLYAAGVDGIVLPKRNWMSAAGIVARASAGTSERFQLFYAEPEKAVSVFQKAGYQILCAGIRNSVSIFEKRFFYPIFLVIGGEKRGISRVFLENADQIVRIDYGSDFRGSLASSASAAILAFELFRQNKKT